MSDDMKEWPTLTSMGGMESSLRRVVRANARINFRFEDGDVYDVDLLDYH